MKSFIKRNKGTFNKSQVEALEKVANMHKKDLLLIQGPVSDLRWNVDDYCLS